MLHLGNLDANLQSYGKGKGEPCLQVRMARYKTRLRMTFFVDVELKDGRVMQGRCIKTEGKTAHVTRLTWSKRNGGGPVTPGGLVGAAVASIDMSDPTDSPDEANTRELISKVRRGGRTWGRRVGGWAAAGGLRCALPVGQGAARKTFADFRFCPL